LVFLANLLTSAQHPQTLQVQPRPDTEVLRDFIMNLKSCKERIFFTNFKMPTHKIIILLYCHDIKLWHMTVPSHRQQWKLQSTEMYLIPSMTNCL